MPFSISKKSKIIIYGYNKRGMTVSKILNEQGYTLLGFFDGNAKRIDDSATVLMPEEIEQLFTDKSEIILFVALQNAMKHDKIAGDLYKYGFKNIIYLPTDSMVNEEYACLLRRRYNQILSAENMESITIPTYVEVMSVFPDIENGIIERTENMVTFWARLETIFSNDICMKTENAEGLQYYGVSLPLIRHYICMFKQMENGCADSDHFIEYCRAQSYIDVSGNILKNKIKDRYNLYLLYKREFNAGMKFFIASAPLVTPNETGGFNIKDGLHRSIFLMLQKLSYLPITIRAEDFEKIYAQKKVEKIKRFMLENHIVKTITPISHPAFYNFPAEKETTEKSVLTAIKEFLGISFLDKKRILDVSDYNSYFARNISRMLRKGETVHIESWETDDIFFKLAQMFNDILNISNVQICHKPFFRLNRQFDIVFYMGKGKKYEYAVELIENLSAFTTEMLFWESTTEDIAAEIEIIMQHSQFAKYHKIHQYFDGEIFKEVGVFLKNLAK